MTSFGKTPDGQPVEVLTLGSAPGLVLEVLTLGATVHRLEVAGGDGRRRNVVLGHGTVGERLDASDYLGATIGRYANRIAGGTFELDGQQVQVPTNDRGNALHGGPDGFDVRVWEVALHEPDAAVLRLVSPDGDMGFPGTLTAQVTYRVDATSVAITFEATTDRATVVNLTNHTYWNLDGAGTVDGHLLHVDADAYTPVDASAIPLGEHEGVDGTPFDFREPKALGPATRDPYGQVAASRGIDHNYVVRGRGLRLAATLQSSGTRLELWSDQPGLQVYTGNNLDGTGRSLTGLALRQGDGIALEPQLFPDTPNRPQWPSARLEPGERYVSKIRWRFGPAVR